MLTSENLKFIKNHQPQIAIIAPPLDSIPTPSGNAVYTLVEQIAQFSSKPLLVFSIKPSKSGFKSSIDEQIIYYPKKIKEGIIQRVLGYRITKRIFGHFNLHYYPYFKYCYKICTRIGIKLVLQEESIEILNCGYGFNGNIIIHVHQLTNQQSWKGIIANVCEVVFVSRTSMERHNKGHERFPARVIYNGIDLGLFKINRPETLREKSIISFLYVGRLNFQKGVLSLINAFSGIPNQSIQLIIIGNPEILPEPKFLEEFYNLMRKDNRISFEGPKAQHQLPQFYIEADFVVCPSIGQEGLPKVVSESLVMGTPVIASDRGGVKELIVNDFNGLIIDEPVSELTIREKLICAIENTDQLCRNALDDAEKVRKKLSLGKMVEEFDELFSQHII